MQAANVNPQFWDELYKSHDTGWDIGYPSPPLTKYIDQVENKNISILVPGCGNSYEAEYMLNRGFKRLTLVDISSVLTGKLEKKLQSWLGRELSIITGNFFDLQGQYDLVLEQTFFCALDPSLRKAYTRQMHALLKPGGTIAGVLFNRQFDQNPPYGGSKEEYQLLFDPLFDIKHLEPCYNSIPPRAGTELFFEFVARS